MAKRSEAQQKHSRNWMRYFYQGGEPPGIKPPKLRPEERKHLMNFETAESEAHLRTMTLREKDGIWRQKGG